MEDKHPVSALQELMAQQYKLLPVYEISDISQAQQPKFRCTVKVDGVIGVAEASQKQAAKKDAAIHALSQLQDTKIIYSGIKSSFPSTISYNAIGKLNEYTAQKRLPYPNYNEYGFDTQGKFIIRCAVSGHVSEGSASTKKAAKQLAAHHMLNKLNGKQLDKVNLSKSLPLDSEIEKYNDNDVFEKFKVLSVSKIQIYKETEEIQEVCNDESKVALDETKVQDGSFETIEDMIQELKRHNISYSIDITRKNPFVLLLRCENKENTTVVETGETYAETHKNVIRKALEVLKALKD